MKSRHLLGVKVVDYNFGRDCTYVFHPLDRKFLKAIRAWNCRGKKVLRLPFVLTSDYLRIEG